MGTTDAFIVLRRATRSAAGQIEASFALQDLAGDWVIATPKKTLSIERLDVAAKRLSSSGSSALGAYVQDSDFAYSLAATDGTVRARLILNEIAARDYEEGSWAVDRCVELAADPVWQPEMSRRWSAWSELAPNAVSPNSISSLIEMRWTYAEDGLGELLGRLGLSTRRQPSRFEGAISLEDRGTYSTRGEVADIADVRYVIGYGSDFVGIWDREFPGPPISRFPRTAKGLARAKQEWFKLVTE